MSRARPKLERLSFDEWVKQAREAVAEKPGVLAEDLPDRTWAMWYEEGLSPGAAATSRWRR